MTVSEDARMSRALDSALVDVPVVGIVRTDDGDHAHDAVCALLDGGLTVAEVTLTTPGALAVVRWLRGESRAGVVIGAGSVRTAADALASIEAGAEFLVTPTTNPAVLSLAREAGVPVLCGAFTPTEIEVANAAGAHLVKLFPASIGGPAYLRDLLAPMPELRIVPTGGVSIDNLGEWFESGAPAVAVGSALVPRQGAAASDIAERAARFVAAAVAARGRYARPVA
ncbi:bifunctional 4-hydroxy-2-oxoglutarate aldolase/2-dehydro-3-deoxy-phosphogluconate aldolase [Herbiconiux sp. CPCC 205763]|uniref:Bifunctional 4-hydroxy-2-oxoglutarate aldolase/2-dehydro-3-deoxy-phosphogluconate aldolase n=1 Tax=Herbiconiux aconitum TaxID=2970913 RepID=A0ABT2GL19_9MICO|nr:bifunctional 4-hydroxy-2-oxoglutarate aldolase/2-dehydro-3-deoxy-phosphogluconate aldolase [Herbiconiux aconitum]MCS5716924.1 bifunctional 4-hydroxy-2-oxoglutarate aldolase/2-dehydro-3-deoxy-phosphogluconate aldolase [Herbiconiux aconitum]